MAETWPEKAPSVVADYTIDWASKGLDAGDTIVSSTWTFTAQAGLSKESDSFTDSQTVIWLAAGTAGEIAALRNTIVTTGGRTLFDDVLLPIDIDLVVEDGSGLAAAESFASVEDADEYCAAYGLSGWSGSRQAKKQALRRAARWLSSGGVAWQGQRVKLRAQGLAFPRAGVVDAEDVPILSTEIPFEIVHAQIELAVYELGTPGGLTPVVELTQRVKSEKIGPLETVYDVPPLTTDSARPVLTKVLDLIAGFISADGGDANLLSGVAQRA